MAFYATVRLLDMRDTTRICDRIVSQEVHGPYWSYWRAWLAGWLNSGHTSKDRHLVDFIVTEGRGL